MIVFARWMVERRWAMTIDVRPWRSFRIAFWIRISVSVSTLDVASSRMRMRGLAASALRERHQLFLPDRKRRSPFLDLGVVPARELLDEPVGPDDAGGRLDAVEGDRLVPQADVRFDVAREEEDVLEHQRDVGAEVRCRV